MGDIEKWIEVSRSGLTVALMIAVAVLWRALQVKEQSILRLTTELVGLVTAIRRMEELVEKATGEFPVHLDRLEASLRAVIRAYMDRLR